MVGLVDRLARRGTNHVWVEDGYPCYPRSVHWSFHHANIPLIMDATTLSRAAVSPHLLLIFSSMGLDRLGRG